MQTPLKGLFGVRAVLWSLGIVAVLAMSTYFGLQLAISRNGPAVLSNIDRITGGTNGAGVAAAAPTGAHEQQKLIVWAPMDRDAKADPLPVLVFVHGGSWRTGDPADYGFIGRSFVPKGFVVVLGGYRLEGDGAYPNMLEDTASVVAWTHQEIAKYGGDPDRITLAGHSAGAYNVAMVGLEPRWLKKHAMSPADIAGIIGISGPYDFFPFDSDSTKGAFGDAPDPQKTQPINHVSGDAPPMLLIHGEQDDLVGMHNTKTLAKLVEQAGGSATTQFYADMNHNDPLISLASPWRSRRDLDDAIVEFASSARIKATKRQPSSGPVNSRSR
ncbi:MAG: alpha/beta hydrolase [Erythrobacter sp.]